MRINKSRFVSKGVFLRGRVSLRQSGGDGGGESAEADGGNEYSENVSVVGRTGSRPKMCHCLIRNDQKWYTMLQPKC